MDRRRAIGPEIRAAHDRIAEVYGLTRADGTLPSPSLADWLMDRDCRRPLAEIVARHFPRPCPLLLDAGCGNGQLSRIFLQMGVERVVGADFAPRMLRAARARLAAAGLAGRFAALQTDLADLGGLRSDSFAAACLFGVIEHLDRPAAVLDELARVLRPGGVLVASVPLRGSIGHLTYLAFGRSPHLWGREGAAGRRRGPGGLLDRARYYRFYSPDFVPRLLATRGGLTIVARIPFARFYLDGRAGAPLHRLAARGPAGYARLDRITAVAARIYRRPGAEYLVIRKDG